MNKDKIYGFQKEAEHHLKGELLPFWMKRIKDEQNGGFITHFDKNGKDSGENEKSMLAQARSIYSMSSAHRHGYGLYQTADLARYGFDFLINKIWDEIYGGFYWMVDRKGNVLIEDKILYGHSFIIYGLAEYTMATKDYTGLQYAEKVFDLIQEKCRDPELGGYFEMFDRQWNLAGPGAGGGDRKTLDVHMHLMEAFTGLYECTGKMEHRKALLDIIELLIKKMLHPEYRTGIPQFTPDWKVAPQIKFNIVWGWDRFPDGQQKDHATDNTSAGHNTEFAWLLIHALNILKTDIDPYLDLLKTIFEHTYNNGIDWKYGGVFVEGPHSGGVYDMEKEFWQQAEVMIGMLDAYLLFGDEKYLDAYENVHRFLFDKMINHPIGEWWPLLTREGKPIWTHMSHSWKVNYHTIRCMIQCIQRLNKIKNK